MSHYSVLVLHKKDQDINTLLAPYSENIKVEPYLKHRYSDAIKILKEQYVPYNDFLKEYSDDELLEWFVDQYSSYFLKDGGVYTTYNPNSRWDWYSIGGRFSDGLELTEEGRLNAVGEIEKKYHIDIDLKNLYEDSDYLRYVDTAPLKYIQWFTPLSPIEKEELRRW